MVLGLICLPRSIRIAWTGTASRWPSSWQPRHDRRAEEEAHAVPVGR
jgi:hypothetical protein